MSRNQTAKQRKRNTVRLFGSDGYTFISTMSRDEADAEVTLGLLVPCYQERNSGRVQIGYQRKPAPTAESKHNSPTTITKRECEANAGLAPTESAIYRAQAKVREFGLHRLWAQGVCTIYMTREQIENLDSYSA